MNRVLRFFLVLVYCFCLTAVHPNDVEIRPAKITELGEILALDREITYEYFRPICLEYSDRSVGQDPGMFLEEELRRDECMFPQVITGHTNQRLIVALKDGAVVGLALFSIDDESVVVDLLMIKKEHRRQGIGKRLVNYILSMPGVSSWRFAVIKKNHDTINICKTAGCKLLDQKPDDMGNDFPADCADIYQYFEYTK